MKFIRWTSTSTTLLFIATIIPLYAQRDGQGDKQEKGGGQQQQPQRAQQPQQQPKQQQRGLPRRVAAAMIAPPVS